MSTAKKIIEIKINEKTTQESPESGRSAAGVKAAELKVTCACECAVFYADAINSTRTRR